MSNSNSKSSTNMHIDLFREQILTAAKNKTPLSIEGGGTKSWYGNAQNTFSKLHTRAYSGILEYQPEELVITACAIGLFLASVTGVHRFQSFTVLHVARFQYLQINFH